MPQHDQLVKAKALLSSSSAQREEDSCRYHLRGDVFMTLRDSKSQEVLDYREHRNLVVKDASILIARLLKDPTEPLQGLFCLAVGTGDSGWNPMSPPAPTTSQRALYAEIGRKRFSSTNFVDSLGAPTATPTNVVDFNTTFTESEAVGPLVEMALLGGNISTNMSVRNPVSPPNGLYNPLVSLVNFETMFNVLNFPVVNKPSTGTWGLTWRITV